MKIITKHALTGFAIVAGGVGLFFLATFSFLAMKGHLDSETLTRLPLVGKLFENDHVQAQRLEIAAKLQRIEKNLAHLEDRLAFPKEGAAQDICREDDRSVLFLDSILVNLHDTGGKRFLRSRFILGIETADEEEAQETYNTLFTAERRAVIRDAMLRVCREKSLADLEEDFELNGLRKEIAQAVQEAAFSKMPGRVKEVYVSEFLVQ